LISFLLKIDGLKDDFAANLLEQLLH